MAATITGTDGDTSFTIAPTLVVGWAETATVGNIIHKFVDGSVGATLIPAAPSSGTVTLLFSSLADAETASAELRTATGLLTMLIDDSPATSRQFVVVGTVDLALDAETAAVWTVAFGFQEIV